MGLNPQYADWIGVGVDAAIGAMAGRVLLTGPKVEYTASRVAVVEEGAAAKTGAGLADDAFNHGFKYDPRVRARGVQDPSSHNFPYSFDDGILATKPIPQKNGYNIYQQPGSMAGKVVTDPKTGIRTQTYKDGVFEIGVTKDGVIDHRFFRPN